MDLANVHAWTLCKVTSVGTTEYREADRASQSDQLRPSAGQLHRRSFTAAAQPISQEDGWHRLSSRLPLNHFRPKPKGRTEARICRSVLCGGHLKKKIHYSEKILSLGGFEPQSIAWKSSV
jgi:hypothetical protein